MSGFAQLLVLKVGTDYIRVRAGTYLPCSLQQASVFAADQLETVRGHRDALQRTGIPEVRICRLTIDEEILACD